ncbi:MAG TPA: hypothetical protein VFR58_11185 [Flavisolibacter sp.]|nr:hypothetical protein [Flavisolibacter sp.]
MYCLYGYFLFFFFFVTSDYKPFAIKTSAVYETFAIIVLFISLPVFAQEKNKEDVPAFSGKQLSLLGERANGLRGKLDKATEKYLQKLQRQEKKLRRKLGKLDSLQAQALFGGIDEKYASLQNSIPRLSRYTSVYSGRLDSLATSLNFFKATGLPGDQIDKSLGQLSSLQDKLNQTEVIKKFVRERRQLLKQQFEKLGMLRKVRAFQKQSYYYAQRLEDVKALWQDPSRIEEKLLQWVAASDKFKDFFRQNSRLASLFPLPGMSSNPGGSSVAGLQTRASLQQALTAQFGIGSNVQRMLQQNIESAQGQLSELRSRISQYGSGGFGNGEPDMPENFRPNSQKTKTIFDRLEYGLNVQSQKANGFFPTTSDIGISLGYKLNDKSSFGIGASYKLGWGRGLSHIRMTSEGLGLRSYLDYKLKGSLYISGGYEQNYRTAFNSIQQLRKYSAWQSSGLLGLSKRYKVSRKVKGDIKLLWDFLSYRQLPRTQAILFRVSYNLK